MSRIKSLKNSQSLVLYVLSVAVLVVGLLFLVLNVYGSYAKLLREDSAKLGAAKVQRDAASVEMVLRESMRFLDDEAHRINDIMEKGGGSGDIENLLAIETDRFVHESNPNFRGLFAYINDHLVDPLNWQSDHTYDPTKRPWYYEAFKQRGEIAIVPTYTDAKYSVAVVSVCKRLADKRSVLVFNILLSKIKEQISDNIHENDQWFILSKDGLVVAHSVDVDQGKGYLSSAFWGSEKEALARRILQADDEKFDFSLDNRDYTVYTQPISKFWYMVRLVDDSFINSHDVGKFIRNVIVVLILFVLVLLLLTLIFRNCAKAEESNRKKLMFIGNICQELRAPINAIVGLSSVVQRNSREKGISEYAANIKSASNSLLSVINDVQDVARIEGGVFKLSEVEYDLFSVLKDCLDEVSPRAAAKNLRLSIDCNPEMPSGYWGDRGRIRQSIKNVITNAVEHTEVGFVQIMVDYSSLPTKHGLVTGEYIVLNITVNDSGTGQSNPEMDGAGLGTDLVKMLVNAYGGEFTIRSQYGEGTSVNISIPQLVLNNEAMGDFSSKYRELSGENNETAERFFIPGVKILVVDDMEMNLKVFCGLLRDSKAQIDTALNGAKALELIRSRRYNIIFLDHMMPLMDGFETLERMKAMENNPNKDTPVVMFTANTGESSRKSFLTAGFADYISKPIKERDLVRLLKWHLPKELVLTQEDRSEVIRERIETVMAEEAEEIELQTITVVPMEKLAPFRDFLNVDVGMEYCANDEDFFIEMLREYVNDEKSNSISSTFERRDWKNYQILVHALKSTSLTIGAERIFEMAKNIDLACKESRYDYAVENHREFLEAYTTLIGNIRNKLGEK